MTTNPEDAQRSYDLPKHGFQVPLTGLATAIEDSRQAGGQHLWVANGLNGEFLAVGRLFIDDDGDVILWLT